MSRPAAWRTWRSGGLALLAAVVGGLALPATTVAMEPRFDHRDQQGLLAELGYARDSVVFGGAAHPSERLALRLAWSFDLSGEGDELQLGGTARLGSWSDPGRERCLAAVDGRYRAYFGSEELKTFVEVGAWANLVSKVVVGALGGLGLEYDPSRAWGVYAAARFAGGYGQARVASVSAGAGVQLRW